MRLAPGTASPSSAPEGEGTPDVDVERWVRCTACGARVAPESARIAVGGAHEHEFMNPSGLRFTVGCWATAPGCVPEGERSSVWTWFPGHAWQIELCAGCGAHLGWSFHGASSFYGLVRDRVR